MDPLPVRMEDDQLRTFRFRVKCLIVAQAYTPTEPRWHDLNYCARACGVPPYTYSRRENLLLCVRLYNNLEKLPFILDDTVIWNKTHVVDDSPPAPEERLEAEDACDESEDVDMLERFTYYMQRESFEPLQPPDADEFDTGNFSCASETDLGEVQDDDDEIEQDCVGFQTHELHEDASK